MSIAQWTDMHAEDIAIAEKGEAQLLFLGDSITAGWDYAVWQQYFAKHQPANFGIGGDKTQNVLWRLQNGGSGKLAPQVIVLMIGVNNFGHENATAEEVFAGVKAILAQTDKHFPDAKTVLLSVLPYGEKGGTEDRARVVRANQLLAGLDDKPNLSVYNFGDLFVDEDGNIPKALMGDFLHPTPAGYKVLAEKLSPIIDQLMGGAAVHAADNEHVQVVGRYAETANGGLLIGYPAVTANIRFQGNKFDMLASSTSGNNYVDLFIDDEFVRTIQIAKGSNTYELVNSSSDVLHNIALVNRSETWHGLLEIKSFDLNGGKLLEPVALPKRKLLVIGDSVTCGEAIDRGKTCDKNPSWWNPKYSYGMLIGEKLNAQTHLVCYGGRGLIRTWDGKTDVANAPQFFNASVAKDEGAPQWDHSRFTPDLILISLGTNDFSLGIGALPKEDIFVSSYVKFIENIQAVHPNAKIVLTEGAIVNDKHDPKRPQKSVLRSYLDKTKAQSNGKLNGKVSVVYSEYHPGDECDAHPNKAQHASMAEELTPPLAEIMNW